MSRKLIEKYRRKPDFDEERCVPIRLADGQEWMLRRPWMEIIPHFEQGKAVDYTPMPTLRELDPLLEAIGGTEDPMQQSMLVLTLGALMLQWSYDITDAELSKLFILRPGDPESDQVITDILDIATGKSTGLFGWEAIADPKAPAGASESC